MAVLAQLNEEAVINRLTTLPQELQEAVDDPTLKTAVDDVARDYGFDEKETSVLEAEMTICLLGFVHTDDLADELKEITDMEDATEIAGELKTILAPYQPTLDKIFQAPVPVSKAQTPSPLPTTAAGPMLDLSRPAPVAAPQSAPAPAPLPSTSKTPAAAPAPASQPAAPAAPAMPRPFMLQKETSATPAVSSSNFKLNLRAQMFAPAPAAAAPSAPPPRPAQLELGKEIKKEAVKSFTTAGAPDASRIVHYTGFKSSLGIPAAPMPAAAPAAPGAPKPNPAVPLAAQQISGFSLGKSMSPGSNPVSLVKPGAPAPINNAGGSKVFAAVPAAGFTPSSTATPQTAQVSQPVKLTPLGGSGTAKPTSPAVPVAGPVAPPATGFIRNAPGVAPLPREEKPAILPAKPAGAVPAVPSTASAAVPRVVNFSAEDNK